MKQCNYLGPRGMHAVAYMAQIAGHGCPAFVAQDHQPSEIWNETASGRLATDVGYTSAKEGFNERIILH